MQGQDAPPLAPEAELPLVGPPPVVDRSIPALGLAAGVALLWGAGLLLAAGGRDRWGVGGDGGGVLAGAGVVAAVAAVLATRPRSLRAALLGPWAAPPGWAVFALGVAVGLPFLATAGSVVWDADSSRLLASFIHVRQHGPGFIVDTQDVVLPYLLLGVPMTL